MAAITADGRQELVALYLTMFGTAPTTVQLAQMVGARESGSTLAQVATTLSTNADFALVASKDADSFATYLANALLASDTPASARAWAINWVVTQVQGVKTKAQVIAEAVQAIRATTNTNYTTAKAELAADVTVSLNNIDNPAPVTSTFTLTASLDTGTKFTGGAGNDTFSAVETSVAADDTFTTGDSLVGGAGTDKLTVAVSGTPAGATTAGVATDGIEQISVYNNSTAAYTLDAALMTGVTDFYVNGGAFGSTITGVSSLANLHLLNTNVAATLTATAATVAGESDSATIAASGVAQTAGVTATYQGLETINLVASGAVGTATNSLTVVSADLETLNISGSGNVNVTVNLDGADAASQVSKLDASNAKGTVTAAITIGGSGKLSVTGSPQNDAITLVTSPTQDMTINGGTGTDTLTVTGATTYSSTTATHPLGKNITNFETLGVSGGGSVDLRQFSATTFTAATAAAGATLSKANAELVKVTLTADGSLTHTLNTDTAADSLTVALAPSTPGAITVAALSVADVETLTVTTSSTGTNTITALTGVDLTKLVVSGTQAFTVTDALTDATLLATVDASALSGSGSTFNLNAGVSTKAMTVTLGGGIEATAGSTVNTITTGTGADTVTGGAYKDVITTGAGADSVSGGAGNDVITAGLGNDIVDGGAGNDSIDGGSGDDSLSGGDGDDTVDGGAGTDSVYGGAGNDTLYVASLASGTVIDGGALTDTLSANSVTTTAIVAADFVAVAESAAPTITGVETAYIELDSNGTDHATAATALTLDLTASSGLTTLNLNLDSGNNEHVKVTKFGGSTIVLRELSGADAESIVVSGTGSNALTFTATGYKNNTSSASDLTVSGVSSLNVRGTSYVSTSPQDNAIGAVVAATAGAVTLSTTGNTTAANATALTVASLTAANATSVTVSVGQFDTLTSTADIVTTNSLVDTLSVTLADDSTFTVGGGDIDLKSSAVQTATVTVGVGATVSALDIEATSITTLTATLGAASTVALDFNAAITSGTVTLSSGSAWTFATAGAAGAASSLTITGRGEVVNGTAIVLAGSTFTFNAGGLTDTGAAGLTVDASNLTGVGTLTGTNNADTFTGSAQADVISGGLGADTITGGLGADSLTGGSGADHFSVLTVASSAASVAANTTRTFDSITDFTTTSDKISVAALADLLAGADATGVTVTSVTTGGASLNDTTIANFAELKVAVDALGLVASAAGAAGAGTGLQAYLIDLTGNTGALGTGKYLVLNDTDTVLTAADAMIQIVGTVVAGDFVV